ncbi:MAG TPA: PKD domain-containing protein [Microthrixaceae bacterium]|nr:PKD domain-containing protein [Microthrixaceae bacterium]
MGYRSRFVAAVGVVALLFATIAWSPPSAEAATTSVSFPSVPIASWRVNGTGTAILKVGNTVYVGGSYSRATSPNGATSVNRANLAAFNATTGALLTTFQADTNGSIRDIQTDGSSIFVAGNFTTIGGVARSRLAAIDPTTGTVRTGFRADVNGTVYNMSLGGGKLYVAGAYTSIGGVNRTRLAAVSPTTGSVNSAFNPVIDGTVLGVAAMPDGSKVYLGGRYANINGTPSVNLGTLDGVTGAITGPTLTGVTGFIDELEVTEDATYLIAGHSGVPGVGNRTAVYDTATGARRWRQYLDGDSQGVHAIGDTVFSGFHDGVAGDAATRMTSNNLVTGARDVGFAPTFDRFMGVWAISGDTDALVIAGEFSTVSGVAAQGFAIFRSGPPTQFVTTAWGDQPWKYLDDGSNQGTAWNDVTFNDSSWRSGTPRFGYGQGDERTRISWGPSSSNRYITTYFRRAFNVSSTPGEVGFYARIDDGAVIYINGVEAARDNMPAGPITSSTLAATERSASAGNESRYIRIDPGLLHVGTNTIAVEVHKAATNTTRLLFFPTLVAYGTTAPNQSPSASFSVSPSTGPEPLPVTFDGSASADPDGSIVNYTWNFGDGTTATGVSTSKTFGNAGTYIVSLTVTDNRGSSTTTTRTVTVTPGQPNQLPTASFTASLTSGQAPLAVGFNASASNDPDGSIASYAWNFGDGTTATGVIPSKTFLAGGTFVVALTVTDNRGGTASSTQTITVAAAPGPPVDVPRSATWKYLDTGIDQGTAWTGLGFDDSLWKSGVGEFGYGDGDENTVVSYGPTESRKYPTTYFRHTFGASSTPSSLTFSMRVDDGAVVYVNGIEAARFNMGTGPVSYGTRAPLALSNGDERRDRTFSISAPLITPGANVIAVEVHQNTLGSTDLSFWGSLSST